MATVLMKMNRRINSNTTIVSKALRADFGKVIAKGRKGAIKGL